MQEDINAFFCVKIILTASRENAQWGCFDHPFFVLLNFVQVVFLNLNDMD